MATIQDIRSRVEKIDFNDLIVKSIRKTTSSLVNLQQIQLLEGKRSDGSRIGRYRNKIYASYKYGSFSPVAGFGFVDLTLTRRFSNAIFARLQNDGIVFGSSDSKAAALEKKYGKTIFGLDDENAEIYSSDTLSEEVINQIYKDVYQL